MQVVDDSRALISSANLNDRSLLGDRDSELGVLIADAVPPVAKNEAAGEATADGVVRDMRLRLWAEHLGMTFADAKAFLDDPSTDECWELWTTCASRNTRIYEAVFQNSIPSNCHATWADFVRNTQ